MKKSGQKGFAALEALLVVVIIGLLGFTGWYVWHSKQATDTLLTNTAASQPALQKKKTTTKGSATTIFKLSKLGIEFSVPASLKDLTYGNFLGPNQDSYGNDVTSVNMSTSALTKIDLKCSASETVAGIGTIEVGTGQLPSSANIAPFALVKQLSDKWVAFASPQMSCSSNQTAIDTAITDTANLQTALKSVETLQ